MANIIALLAVTGMRIGEALRLRPQDINPEEATVLVRANKHGPDRLIPLHPSTIEALLRYETHPYRRATHPPREATLFVTTRGRAYQRMTVDSYFQRIRETADFTGSWWFVVKEGPRVVDV